MLQIGSVVEGKYKVLSKIGQGGMSIVYLALNERANKTWAIKEVRKDGLQDFDAVKQGMTAEINILKNLSHKYLPSIVDIIDEEDTLLIVMDYIQGKSLDLVLKEKMEEDNHPMAVNDVISWGIQLCEVMDYLHSRSRPIIYRDLKPANVMLRPDGEISLIDFGTARVFKRENSEDTICLGTPGFASPEQYGGKGQSGPQSDIYCLGATLHYLVTGRNPVMTPFHFPPITRCRPALLEETPREFRDALPGLEMIIAKCTRYEPENRYQNCAEVKYDLSHPEELGLPYRRKLRRKLAAFCLSATASLLFGGVSLFGKFMEQKTETTGYTYYIERAVTSASGKKIGNYQKAVALNPVKEEAWLGILDALEEDNDFSSEEDQLLTALLNERSNGRSRDNQSCFHQNRSGYVKFSYRLGLMYYYSGGSGGSKSSAVGWFENVTSENLDKLDLGKDEKQKSSMRARAEILGKISSYNRKIGQVNQAGDAEVSYSEYWYDLMALIDEKTAMEDNIITELRLYHEVVYQVCTNYDKFKESGISREEMEAALAQIRDKAEVLDLAGNSALAREIQASVQKDLQIAKRQVAAIFAPNAEKISMGKGDTEE